MKKSLLLCCLFICCISSNKLIAQTTTADSSSTNSNASYSVTSGVKIYPNPVRDVLQIEGLDPSVKNVISVSSSYGRIIFQSRLSGSGSYSANVGKLEPGLYYVTIKQKGNSILLRFLKE
jgi:hypothetical protein